MVKDRVLLMRWMGINRIKRCHWMKEIKKYMVNYNKISR